MNEHAVNFELSSKDIDRIIDETALPSTLCDLKSNFKKLFKALKAHETKTISEIQKQIVDENVSYNTVYKIYTILVPNDKVSKWSEKGFFPILDDDYLTKKSKEYRFFNGSYEELMVNINAGKISLDCSLVDREKCLFQIAEWYDIKIPVIFSPWSRRMVKCNGDFDSSKKIIEGCIPMWNVRYEKAERIAGPEISVAPDNDNILYNYEFAGMKGSLLYIESADINRLNISYSEYGDIKIISYDQINLDEVMLLTVNDVGNASEYFEELTYPIFVNSYDVCRKHNSRLFTKGDIDRLLQCFKYDFAGLNFKCSFSHVSVDGEMEINYYKGYSSYKYAYSDENMLYYSDRRHMRLPWCYVEFEGNNQWLEDYAEYVLAYTKRFYPDYRWVGVHHK